jgi:MFS family permease
LIPDQSQVEAAENPAKPGRPSGLAATFRSLRHRNYRLYFFGQLISLIGTWMQTTAVTWLAFKLTQQSSWSALVGTATIFPTFIFGAWGGVLADRWPKRSLIFATQSLFLLLALLLAGLALGGIITPWQLLLVTLAGGVVQAIDLPARLSFVMDMAGREDLMNAVALNSLLFNVARALGPALAGLLLYLLDPWACFLANAISYLAVLWALAFMNISGHPGVVTDRGSKPALLGRLSRLPRQPALLFLYMVTAGRSLFSWPFHIARNWLRALLAGFGYLSRQPALLFLVLLATTTSLFGWPFRILLPALSEHQLAAGDRGYSFMLSATGLGALAAAWTVATFGSIGHSRLMITLGVCIISGSLVALSCAGSLASAAAACALLGYGLILFLSTSQSVVQLSTTDHNRGRIMGIWAMTQSGAVPLGDILAGPAADIGGSVRLVLGTEGLACAGAALALLGLFRWRQSVSDRAALVTGDTEVVPALTILPQGGQEL